MHNRKLYIIFGILLAITLISIVGSLTFSVKNVVTYCQNYNDSVAAEGESLSLSQKVKQAVEPFYGYSIFGLDKSQVAIAVEDKLPSVKVINVEKRFPNILCINYVVRFDYYQVSYPGGYYICDIDGKITSKVNSSDLSNHILLRMHVGGDLEVGQYITDGSDRRVIHDIIDSFERMDFRDTDLTTILKEVDFTYSDYHVLLTMNSGVVIKLYGTDGIDEMLNGALSLYFEKYREHSSGEIKALYVVGASGKKELRIDFSETRND